MRFITALLASSLFGVTASEASMTVTSRDLTPGRTIPIEQVFNAFGCTGKNMSPELTWSGAPAATKSYAIMAYDPDAPTGSGWWHWTVFDLPAETTGIATGASGKGTLPASAVEGRTDFGKPGYDGPCPPVGHGAHHYQFTVYALSVDKLPVDANASAATVGLYVRANALDHATVEVTYGR